MLENAQVNRSFGQRCTRCLQPAEKLLMLPVMGCMVTLCGECAKTMMLGDMIPLNTKCKIVKRKGGEKDGR